MNRSKIWILSAIPMVAICSAMPTAFSKTAEEANNELRDAKPYGRFMHAAETADKQGNNAEAEKNFSAAMQEAEKLGVIEKPKKMTLSILGLARVYAREGKNADAEALYKRALATAEKPLPVDQQEASVLSKLNLPVSSSGSDLMLTTVLFHYADFLRKTNRTAEADKMDARGKALREKLVR